MTAAVPLPPLERAVQQRVVAIFAAFGGIVYNLAQGFRPGGRRHGTTRQTKGLPDLWIFFPARGRGAWFEVKRPGAELRAEQETFRVHCAACGIAHGWGGADEAYSLLERLGFKLLLERVGYPAPHTSVPEGAGGE